MFDAPVSASIRRVDGIVKEDGDHVLHRIRVTLERTFSPEIARGLGTSAKVAQNELEGRGMEKVVLGIGAIRAALDLEAIDTSAGKIRIPDVVGIKAVAVLQKAGGRDEEDGTSAHPLIRLQFAFPFSDEAWVFLGRHLHDTVNCLLTRTQLELPLAAAAPNGKRGRKKAAADPQQAATPEEAERIHAVEFSDLDDADDSDHPIGAV